jgi:hypothetical protein
MNGDPAAISSDAHRVMNGVALMAKPRVEALQTRVGRHRPAPPRTADGPSTGGSWTQQTAQHGP